MLRKLLRTPHGKDVEVGVAIPIGCMVPLAIGAAVLTLAGLVGVWVQRAGGRVVATQVVPLH